MVFWVCRCLLQLIFWPKDLVYSNLASLDDWDWPLFIWVENISFLLRFLGNFFYTCLFRCKFYVPSNFRILQLAPKDYFFKIIMESAEIVFVLLKRAILWIFPFRRRTKIILSFWDDATCPVENILDFLATLASFLSHLLNFLDAWIELVFSLFPGETPRRIIIWPRHSKARVVHNYSLILRSV